jgi:hypothetical protein
VLECLLAAEGRPVPAEELLERVWDEAADPFTSTVKTTVGRLRAKLGSDPPVIQTVRESGYRIGAPYCALPVPRAGSRLRRRPARLRLTVLYGTAFLTCGRMRRDAARLHVLALRAPGASPGARRPHTAASGRALLMAATLGMRADRRGWLRAG